MLDLARRGWPLLVLLACGSAAAQSQTPPPDPGEKSVRMVRTEVRPVVDGKLDEPIWATAAFVDDLHQTAPVEYAEPDEKTEIYLLYDDDNLYVGAKLYDNDPAHITAQNLRQNDNIGQDDRFYVTLDPFFNHRSGYYFGVNPNGVRTDGLYLNVTDFYGAWDTIFEGQAGRFENGWIAEIAIPFKSLSFDPHTDTWGLNFSRGVVRKNENLAWVSRNRAYNPSISGTAVGFQGLDPRGLDVVPSLSLNSRHTFATGRGPTVSSSGSDSEPSLDVAYKLTPLMNASLTINTDFSATEVDDRQVNLTRFGLFFPEKRDFFLREADIFEFGRIGIQGTSFGIQRPLRENGRAFFSRQIGLSGNGQLVDLDYGGKISGRVGRVELGALSIRQDDFVPPPNPLTGLPTGPDIRAQTLSVVRAKMGVLAESSVGMIATSGNPSSNADNSVAGLDFLYRNTRLPGGRALESDVWYEQSDTEGLDADDAAYGADVRLPTATGFRGGVGFKVLEDNFIPGLGYLDRNGVRDTFGDVGYTYRPRGKYVQSFLTNLTAQSIDLLANGGLQQEIASLQLEITNRTADVLMFVPRSEKQVIPFGGFEISRGIVIPQGDYSFGDFGAEIRTGNHRKVAGTLRIIDGDFYGGRRQTQLAEVTWRPSPRYRTNVSYQYDDITLPQGDFEVRLVRFGFDVVFSSTLSWVNLIQYDNVTETAGVNMRLHWIPEAGREVFFVINQNLEDYDLDNSFHSAVADVTAKMSYTFRF
jgi:hypothetical protein